MSQGQQIAISHVCDNCNCLIGLQSLRLAVLQSLKVCRTHTSIVPCVLPTPSPAKKRSHLRRTRFCACHSTGPRMGGVFPFATRKRSLQKEELPYWRKTCSHLAEWCIGDSMCAACLVCTGNSQNVSSLDPLTAGTDPPEDYGSTSRITDWCLVQNDSSHMSMHFRRHIEQHSIACWSPCKRN